MSAHKLSRREFLRTASLTLAGASLAACAPTPAPTPTAAPKAEPTKAAAAQPPTTAPKPASRGPITIWGWWIPGWEASKNFAFSVREWLEEDTGIKAEATIMQWGDMQAAVRAAFTAGTVPDVLMTNWQVVQPYASTQFLSPLEDMAKLTWGNWKEQFSPGAVAEIELLGKEDGSGHMYVAPWYDQCLGMMFYSKPMFEKAGIAGPPKTWTEMEAIFDKLQGMGVIPFAVGAKDDWNLWLHFGALAEVKAPGKFEAMQDGKAKLTDPELLAAARLFKDLVDKKWVQDGAAGSAFGDASQLVITGKAAMWLGGSEWASMAAPHQPPETKAAGLTWASFAPPPTMPDAKGKGLAGIGLGMALPKGAKNKETGWEFCKWASSGRGQEAISRQYNFASNVKYKPALMGNVSDQDLMGPIVKQIAAGGNAFRYVRCSALGDQIGKSVQGIMSAQVSPEKAMSELQDIWDSQCRKK